MRVLPILTLAVLAAAGVASAEPGSPPPPPAAGGWNSGGWNGAPQRGQMMTPPPGHPPIAAGQMPPPGHPPMMGAGPGRPDRHGKKGRWYGGRGNAGGNYYFVPGGPFGGGYYYVPQPYGYSYAEPAYSEPAYSYAPPPPGPPMTYVNPTGPIVVAPGTTVIVKVTPTVTRTVTEEWVYPKAGKKGHWGSKTKLRHR